MKAPSSNERVHRCNVFLEMYHCFVIALLPHTDLVEGRVFGQTAELTVIAVEWNMFRGFRDNTGISSLR